MKFIITILVIVVAFSQTPTLTPTTTPMGSPMFAYPLSFPNSDPAVVAHPERLVYLMTAIACAANVSAELVYISYIRANSQIVTFEGPPHNTVGLVKNCTSLMPPESYIIASRSMLVIIYYLSPWPANPSDIVFRNYAAATGTRIVVGYAGVEASVSPPASMVAASLSAGDIVGIVGGVIAMASLIALLYLFYVYRDKSNKSYTNSIVVNPKDDLIFFRQSCRDIRVSVRNV